MRSAELTAGYGDRTGQIEATALRNCQAVILLPAERKAAPSRIM